MSFSRPHFLVAGLGNIPLPNTRHSVGHLVVDSLAERLGITLKATGDKKWAGWVAEGRLGDAELTLFKHSEHHV